MAKQKNTIGPKVIVDGETEFRNAIKNIENTMKTLNSEMKLVTSQFDKNDNSVEALTAKNTVLNKIIEEQKKKVEELRKGLESATKSYGENDERTQEWQRDLNNATAKLNDLENQLNSNNKKLKDTERGFNDAGEKLDEFGNVIEETSKKTSVFGDVLKANLTSQAIISGIKSLASEVKDLLETSIASADETQKLADVYGLTAEKIQELRYAGTKLDVDLETILGAQTKLTKSMYEAKDGTGEQAEAFKALGVSVTDANGNLRNAQDVMSDALDALNGYANETERDALAMKIFGKSAMELNPLIKAGGTELAKLTAEARKTGAVLSDETMASIDEFGDNIDAMKLKIQASITKGLTPLIPKLQDITDKVAKFNPEPLINGLGWIIDNSGIIISGITGITAGLVAFKVGSWIDAGLTAIIASWRAYKAATEGATVAQWALNAAQSASPIGLLATGIGLLTAGLTAYALTANDATEATSQLNKEVEESNQTIESNIKSREDNIKSIESEYGAAQKLADTLYDLADKTNKTSTEKVQMASLVEQLNKAIPDLNLNIDKETGALSKQRDEVNKLIEANLTYYKVKAAQESLTTIASDIFTAENNLKLLEEERIEVQNRLNENIRKFSSGNIGSKDEAKKLADDYKNLKSQLENIDETIPKLKKNIEDANKQWNAANEYIKNNADVLKIDEKAVTDTSDAIKDASIVVKQTLNDLTDVAQSELKKRQDALEKSYNEAIKTIRDEYGVYEEAEKSKTEVLQDQLSEKQSLIENMLSLAQSAASQESEAFAKSSEQILEYARQLHNEKISMYMEEYLAQISAIDERVAAEIQAYQDEINAIEKAQEEEDAAYKEAQNKKKIQDLQDKVDKAKYDEERKKAEEDLQEEIARQQREALKEQRQARIKELNQQIKDATEKAKEEKNNLLEVLKDRVENEKKIIEEQTNYNIRKIQEERKAKEEAETAKYNAAKKTLDDTEKALDDYLKKFKDKLSEETSSNIEAVAELAKLLNGTGIVVYSGLTGEGISTEGVSDNAPTRTSIQNSHYRLNHGLTASAKVEPFNSGLSLTGADTVSSQGYKDILNTASRAINDAIKAVTSPTIIVQNQQTVYPSTTNVVQGTAKISDADKADIVRMTVSELKQFNIILDGDKVGKFAVQAVSREMSIQ